MPSGSIRRRSAPACIWRRKWNRKPKPARSRASPTGTPGAPPSTPISPGGGTAWAVLRPASARHCSMTSRSPDGRRRSPIGSSSGRRLVRGCARKPPNASILASREVAPDATRPKTHSRTTPIDRGPMRYGSGPGSPPGYACGGRACWL